METFERLESNVRSYVRSFPTVFERAKGAELWDRRGRSYVDFFAGAGALNYGHNPDAIKAPLIDYLASDGIVHALDMATAAKARFLETFERLVLAPRGLEYKVQFVGPTGTNAVEAALKLARKVTKRTEIVSFTNAFHGMTLGSLSVTGNRAKRSGAGTPLSNVTTMPFDGYLGANVDTLALFEKQLADRSSGLDRPAAVIVETVQGEGGVNVAHVAWLRRLEALCRAHGVLLIVDDIQVGCGRTGRFFSFEEAGIVPDMVTLSKSLSGYGLPMAVVLLRPDLDVWAPGEHNGTFRGFNPGFVTAAAALEAHWADDRLTRDVADKGALVKKRLERMARALGLGDDAVRGRGLIQGLACGPTLAEAASREAFARGLLIETAGAEDQVLKVLPPLTIARDQLTLGLDRLEAALSVVIATMRPNAGAEALYS